MILLPRNYFIFPHMLERRESFRQFIILDGDPVMKILTYLTTDVFHLSNSVETEERAFLERSVIAMVRDILIYNKDKCYYITDDINMAEFLEDPVYILPSNVMLQKILKNKNIDESVRLTNLVDLSINRATRNGIQIIFLDVKI